MAYAGYEDTGVRTLGLERTTYGFVWGNAFGRDHTASFQYTADSRFSRLNAFSGLYSIPTPNRNSIHFYGSYANINSDAAIPFDQGGFAWQTSVRYDHELFPGYCSPRRCREHRLQFGFDFKQSNTNLDFGGINVFNTTTDITQFVLGYTGRFDGNHGTTRLGAEFFYSPGDLSSLNKDVDFMQVRPFATADYLYTRMYLQRLHNLPNGMTFWGSVTGQLAEGNLLPSEQMGLGGYNTVRGYDQRAVNGDSGLLINMELRTEPVPFLNNCCRRDRRDELQLLAFYDQGWAYNHTLLAFEDRPVDIASLGFGFRYSVKDCVALRFDWGWQLADLPQFSVSTDNSRVHVGGVMTY